MASLSSRHAGTGGYRIPDSHGSLDRGLLHGYRLHASHSTDGFLALGRYETQPAGGGVCGGGGGGNGGGSGSCSRTDSCLSSPHKPSTLDLNYSALPESKPHTGQAGSSSGLQGGGQRGAGGLGVGGVGVSVGGSPIQPAVRTQMWLSEQMEYRPGADGCGLGLGAWQQEQQQQRERMRQEAEYTQVRMDVCVCTQRCVCVCSVTHRYIQVGVIGTNQCIQ